MERETRKCPPTHETEGIVAFQRVEDDAGTLLARQQLQASLEDPVSHQQLHTLPNQNVNHKWWPIQSHDAGITLRQGESPAAPHTDQNLTQTININSFLHHRNSVHGLITAHGESAGLQDTHV